MSYVANIVCLANSTKNPGRCVAGRAVSADGFGPWIRPISDRPAAEISHSECLYPDKTTPKLLDIVAISLVEPRPHEHQSENHLVAPSERWQKAGTVSWGHLGELAETPDALWQNGVHTTSNMGFNNCVTVDVAATLTNSLVLLSLDTISIEVGTNPFSGWKTVRADFRYREQHYNFSVTEPVAEAVFKAKERGDYTLENVYVCLSLTEPFKEEATTRCHKLVAGIFTNPPL